jgi:hypothetical protein
MLSAGPDGGQRRRQDASSAQCPPHSAPDHVESCTNPPIAQAHNPEPDRLVDLLGRQPDPPGGQPLRIGDPLTNDQPTQDSLADSVVSDQLLDGFLAELSA